MRNALRVLAFDVLAPLAAIAGLVYVGLALDWPLWWVSVCSVLCLLIVQGMIVDFVLYRRDGVTVGTDAKVRCCGWWSSDLPRLSFPLPWWSATPAGRCRIAP